MAERSILAAVTVVVLLVLLFGVFVQSQAPVESHWFSKTCSREECVIEHLNSLPRTASQDAKVVMSSSQTFGFWTNTYVIFYRR